MKAKLTDGQQAVYEVLKQYGPLPDHALVPLTQHLAGKHLSSSGIRTRRRELETLLLVKPTGKFIKTAAGRNASVFKVIG